MRKLNGLNRVAMLLIATVAASPMIALGDAPTTAGSDALSQKAEAVITKGLDYLKTQQKPDGSWERVGDPPAISALVLKAFVQDPKYNANQEFLKKGFEKLLSYQKPEGGIYRDMLSNYNTAIAISALASTKDDDYEHQITKALGYLRRLQWSDTIDNVPERQQVDQSDPRYGGFGYGKHSRPDGSNLQIALDALHDAGVKPGDPAYKAAVIFETRLQNRSESNNQPWAGNDGGFIYTDANGGNSPAGEYTGPDGRKMFRSYGSMTYGGLKSMIYAGLSKDDPRVKAAWHWIRDNWTFDENPGLKDGAGNSAGTGLYYYYQTAARALHAYGEPVVTDTHGKKHDWRKELINKLASLQKPDGSWVGLARWMENDPTLATSFAILSLQEAQKDLKEHPAK